MTRHTFVVDSTGEFCGVCGGRSFAPEHASSLPDGRDRLRGQPLFRVWDRERQCWAGNDFEGPNVRDLEDYARDEFKHGKFVYCDMEGWAVDSDGVLILSDECGTAIDVDMSRFEIRWNPEFLADAGHKSAERWRERAEQAEAEITRLSQRVQDVEQERDEQKNLVATADAMISDYVDGLNEIREQLAGDGWETAAVSEAQRIGHLQGLLEIAEDRATTAEAKLKLLFPTGSTQP